MSLRVNPHSIVCPNVKKLLAWTRCHIWSLSDSNGIRTHNNHLVRKRTLNYLAKSFNHLASFAKWLSVRLQTLWLWVRILLLSLLQLLINNQVQFVCLWWCILPDFVVMNNFFGLVLFSAVIYIWRGKKLVSKTVKYKLDSSSNMQYAFIYPKNIQKLYRRITDFAENREITLIVRGGRGGGHVLCVTMTQCVRKSTCDSPITRKVIHSTCPRTKKVQSW